MSVICQNFVQNAWKKELCSNCFKSKEEHNFTVHKSLHNGSPEISLQSDMSSLQSIMKNSFDKKPKRNVCFPNEESEIIGYGGEVWSDGEEFELSETSLNDDVDSFTDSDDDKDLVRLTKSNTEFNAFNANLLNENNSVSEMRKTFAQLLLGKPQTDSKGRKQTLKVSVTPFGQESVTTNIAAQPKVFKSKLSHIPIAKNKDALLDSKTNVILTSFSKNTDEPVAEEKSLLEEITETLEKNNSVVQIKNSKNEANQTKHDTNNKNNNASEKNDNEIIMTRAECVIINGNGTVEDTENKLSVSSMKSLYDNEIRKNGVTRHTGIKRGEEKPAIYQNYCNNEKLVSEKIILLTGTNINKKTATEKTIIENEYVEKRQETVLLEAKSPTLIKNDTSKSTERLVITSNNFENDSSDVNNFEKIVKDLNHTVTKTVIINKMIESENHELVDKNLNESKTEKKIIKDESNQTSVTVVGKLENDNNSSSVRKKSFEEMSEKVLGLPPVPPAKSADNIFTAEDSRELAGEPDGRADPDISNEPPELPRSPPPPLVDPRPSFLHNPLKKSSAIEKPRIPAKPNKILQQIINHKPQMQVAPQMVVNKVVIDSENKITEEPEVSTSNEVTIEMYKKTPLSKQDSNGSESNRISSKRKAPKPPNSAGSDEVSNTIYTRNSYSNVNGDSPVAREKEKRERASSCSPKFRHGINNNPNGESTPNLAAAVPEPAPRRSLSLSQDSLTPLDKTVDEKKKARGRFSLKKFLRMGSNKEMDKYSPVPLKKIEDVKIPTPQPKPRLVIVHPLELNGSAVEVVKSESLINLNVDKKLDEEADISNSSISLSSERNTPSPIRPSKPPPPPRRSEESKDSKPSRPPPPKSAELLRQQKLPNETDNAKLNSTSNNNLYANLGEIRSALAPLKPVRTASMREREVAAMEAQKRRILTKNENGYESVSIRNKEYTENIYEYVTTHRSNSPESDFTNGKNDLTTINQIVKLKNVGQPQRRSDGSMENGTDYCKFQSNFPRTASLTYCGSETESEIYSPYSFCGSENDIDDSDWFSPGNRTCKLRSRKGRSVVHKNLEDNYGAVVVANHEALVQVLENVNQSSAIPLTLRCLKTSSNLRWKDFSIVDGIPAILVGKRVFHTALWGAHHVTLCITMEQGSLLQTNTLSLSHFGLTPITEFNDLVPAESLPKMNMDAKEIQATIAVFPWMQVDTIQSMGTALRNKSPSGGLCDETTVCRDACFVLLQLISALKSLQAQGIEEAPLSLGGFVLCRELERDAHSRLCILQGLAEEITRSEATNEENIGSLCECGLVALNELLPSSKITPLIDELLTREKAVSLTQVKSVLEFTLWGPLDVTSGTPVKDREFALQRWLDLERATVLHGLVRSRVQLTVYEEYHLLFLVRSSAKMMCEASVLLDSVSQENK